MLIGCLLLFKPHFFCVFFKEIVMKRLRCGLRTVLLMALIAGLSWFPVAWADLDDGLVAYYPFDGNADDKSGLGNNGTEHGGFSYVTGKIGQAAQIG
jgi:hypothetical protein